MFVTEVNHLFNLRLNYDFSTFIARKQSDIERAAFNIDRILVEYRIHFSMTHVGVFVLEKIVRVLRPGILIVAAVHGKPVVADANDMLVLVDDASANLSCWIFASLSGEKCDAHEVFFPF